MNEAFKRVKNEYLVILVAISMTLLHKYVSITCCIPGTRTEYRFPPPTHPPISCSLHFHSRDNSYIMWYNISIWVSRLNSNNNLDASEVCLRTLVIQIQPVLVYHVAPAELQQLCQELCPKLLFFLFCFFTIQRLG